jgi:putative ABC transport system permease protein
MSTGIPLAWLQLTHEKGRFFAALLGISFAVVLMLAQIGFRDALLSSVGMMQASFIGDLVLISPNYRNLVTTKTFTERRLYQTLSSDAVDSVYPVYLESAAFKNPVTRKEITMYVIGFNPGTAVLDRPGIAENLPKLRNEGMVLFDSIRRPEFGPVSELFQQSGPVVTEIAGKRVNIVGLFQLGTSFGSDGHVVMSDETFLHLLSFRRAGVIDLGLVKLKPGADPGRTRTELVQMLPRDVEVLTKPEFVAREVAYWSGSTPIGFVFGLGVLVGVFIGCIIVYQILYTDVTDHLPEYATLKAMGFRDGFLFKVVMQEALILSILGFFPGVVVSRLVYIVAHRATMLPMVMSGSVVVEVYFLTAVMCFISGLLAVRRLRSADPAEIF